MNPKNYVGLGRNIYQVMKSSSHFFWKSTSSCPIVFHGIETNYYPRNKLRRNLFNIPHKKAVAIFKMMDEVNAEIYQKTGISNFFVLHFDDGDFSIFRVLAELLQSNLRIVLFLNNFDENSNFENRKFLSISQIQYLLKLSANFSVAFHGCNHPSYTNLSLEEIESDVIQNLDYIRLNFPADRITNEFAVPFSSPGRQSLDFLQSHKFDKIWLGFPKRKAIASGSTRLMVTNYISTMTYLRFIKSALAVSTSVCDGDLQN